MSTLMLLALLVSTVAFAAPLLLAALGELVGERAGVLNIGLEGMMLCGAWAGAAASFATQSPYAGLAAAMICAAAVATVFAVFVINLRCDAVIVATGLNIIALGLTGTLHRSLSAAHDAACVATPTLPMCANGYTAITLTEPIFLCMGLSTAGLLWWGMRATRAGLQLRAVGEHPAAAEAAGVKINKTRWLATMFNGAMCGAAGAFLSMSHTNSFAENMTAGRGFIALTVVIFGRWSPLGAVGAAFLFGVAEALQNVFQLKFNDSWYPLLLALPYAVTLLALAGFAGRVRPPAALNLVQG